MAAKAASVEKQYIWDTGSSNSLWITLILVIKKEIKQMEVVAGFKSYK